MVNLKDLINEYTQRGTWECDYTLDRFTKQINLFIEKEGLQLNPDFQRGHVWNEEQQIKYVEHILRGGQTAKVVYLNIPSWHGRDLIDGYDDFVCVDGLQRITAIEKFVNNEIMVCGHYNSEIDGLRGMHGMKININDLNTKDEVLKWYIEMNSGGTPHTKEEIEKVRELMRGDK